MKKIIFGFLLAILAVVFLIAAYLLIPGRIQPAPKIVWGTTFTKSYAQYLGEDWQKVYLAILDDLKVKAVRLGLNWDEIEPEQGQFNFQDYDWMFEEAKKRGVEILPVVGLKLPRWPECRSPVWVQSLALKDFQAAQLAVIKATVEHFKNFDNIKKWQMENEAFISWFGDCPPKSDGFTRAKVKFLRELDPSRPIVMTESGELSSWLDSALSADIVGISLYRQTWNKWFGYRSYFFLSPSFYSRKAKLAGAINCLVKKFSSGCGQVFISELQTEVWSPQGILKQEIDEQLKFMNATQLQENMDYARQTGFDTIYTWGAEWWWWLKMQGHPELWETAKAEFKAT